MFIALTTYLAPLTPDDPDVAEHWSYLDNCYRLGLLVASGPRDPRVGGALVIAGTNRDHATRLMEDDPLVSRGRVSYELLAFAATRAVLPSLIDELRTN